MDHEKSNKLIILYKVKFNKKNYKRIHTRLGNEINHMKTVLINAVWIFIRAKLFF